MPILVNITTPGGAAIGFHVAQRIEANVNDPAQVIMVSMASWPSVEAYDNAQGLSPTWVNWHPVPFLSVQADPDGFSAAVEKALIAGDSQFNGGSYVAMHSDLSGARSRRWANVKITRDILDYAPFEYNGYTIDADYSSRLDILGAITAMQLSGETTKEWRCADNVMRTLTFADLVAIGTGIAARRQGLIETSSILYDEIQDAETTEEVETIGWPP